MSAKEAEKQKAKSKPAPKAAAKPKATEKDQEKEKAKAKKQEADAAAAAAEVKEVPKAAPRPPADPRLKYLKKFHGKFLPRGPLRDRYRALMERWNSWEDHGGVTVEELKSLLEDWRAARAKPPRKTPV